jgi:hypothetical protein
VFRLLVPAALTLAGALAASRAPSERRWVFIHSQLAAPGGVERVVSIMERAAKVGCNGIVLTEDSFSGARDPSDAEKERASAVLDAAGRLGIEIIPTVCGPRAVLRHDVNLVEAMPVRDALFSVANGLAEHIPDPVRRLVNGDFEELQDGRPAGWQIETGPATLAVDEQEAHSGKRSVSLAFSDAGATGATSATLVQDADVTPWRQYVLTVWTRSEGFQPAANFQAWIMTIPETAQGKSFPLAYTQWRQSSDPVWTVQRAVFNSQEHRKVRIRLQAWSARGTLHLDTISLQEVGLLNLVRRPGCPLVVRGEGGTVYEEGRDFEPVSDPALGRNLSPGNYDVYHTPPQGIRLTPNTRIGPNEQLRVSYYHCPVINNNRVATCMSDPKVYDLWRREIRRVIALLKPRTFFMDHDEIRVVGWCASCAERKLTPGQLLADNVRQCIKMIREESPGAQIAAWSDMFDPFHNARDNYYLCNGTLAGSWEGLAPDVIVANWNYQKRAESLKWFADRGHRQVIAGYYDGPVDDVAIWQEASRGIPGIEGMMYTTWVRKYDDLEAFARAAWKP